MKYVIPILALIGLGFLIVSGAVQGALTFIQSIIAAFQNAF